MPCWERVHETGVMSGIGSDALVLSKERPDGAATVRSGGVDRHRGVLGATLVLLGTIVHSR